MNVNVLIDSIVRQTTVLLAQLATTAGMRAPLAHVANQVFLDLVKELKGQGLGNKVIAEMFGMALRTYHDRLRRLSESRTYGGRSLWEALLEYIQSKGTVLRSDILRRFHYDDEATARGVLRDLVASGIVFQSGRGDRTTYRAASEEEVTLAASDTAGEALANLVWVAVNRFAPVTAAELRSLMGLDAPALEAALNVLLADGRIKEITLDGKTCYECARCVIPLGTPGGWEAAVFDHYQAMVTALCTKLRLGSTRARAEDRVGGSTYVFEISPDHPLRDEVLGLLATWRETVTGLREKVAAYNTEHAVPEEERERVICYFGQTLLGIEEKDESL